MIEVRKGLYERNRIGFVEIASLDETSVRKRESVKF